MSEWHMSFGIGEDYGSYLSWGYGFYKWIKKIIRSALQLLMNNSLISMSIDEMRFKLLRNDLLLNIFRNDLVLGVSKVEMGLNIERLNMKLELKI